MEITDANAQDLIHEGHRDEEGYTDEDGEWHEHEPEYPDRDEVQDPEGCPE